MTINLPDKAGHLVNVKLLPNSLLLIFKLHWIFLNNKKGMVDKQSNMYDFRNQNFI